MLKDKYVIWAEFMLALQSVMPGKDWLQFVYDCYVASCEGLPSPISKLRFNGKRIEEIC